METPNTGQSSQLEQVAVLAHDADVKMTDRLPFRLLSLGAGLRMTGASLIVAALWAGFYWAVFS